MPAPDWGLIMSDLSGPVVNDAARRRAERQRAQRAAAETVANLPPTVVEAAARALYDLADGIPERWAEVYRGPAGWKGMGEVAVAAVLPLFRAYVADELDEQANHEAPNASEALRFAAGQIAAGLPQLHARVARGGSDG